jgi:hypothetical protein
LLDLATSGAIFLHSYLMHSVASFVCFSKRTRLIKSEIQ